MLRASIFVLLLLSAPVLGQQTEIPATVRPPAQQSIVLCNGERNAITRKKDPQCAIPGSARKKAEEAFKFGLKDRDRNDFTSALDNFEKAARFAPRDITYATAVQVARQEIVRQTMDSGNTALRKGDKKEALTAFRKASEMDPGNDFAKQRLRDAIDSLPLVTSDAPQSDIASTIQLRPDAKRHAIHFRGNARELLELLARTYGLTAFVDESVLNRPVRAEIEDASWQQSLAAIGRLTKTVWTPLAPNQILFLANDEQNRRMLLRTGFRTFYVGSSTTQELNDLANSLRVLFDIRLVIANPAQGTITVRAPQQVIEAASAFLSQLEMARPQVMLDIEVFEISSTVTRQLGVNIPTSFQVFNVPTEAQKLLGGQSIQDIIKQLENGTLNLSNGAALGALLGQGLQSSVLSQPFASFGGGITLTGLTIPAVAAQFNRNSSTVRSLEHINLRAGQSSPAILKIGSRYPIVSASYSGALSLPASLQQFAGSTNQGLANYPSFTYEDLGVNVKATPIVHRSGDVQLDLEIQLRSVGAEVFPGTPVINNREYKGVITAKDGAPVVVAGRLSRDEELSMQGVSLLHLLPGAGYAFKQEQKTTSENELVIVMTPHVLMGLNPPEATPIAIPDFIPR